MTRRPERRTAVANSQERSAPSARSPRHRAKEARYPQRNEQGCSEKKHRRTMDRPVSLRHLISASKQNGARDDSESTVESGTRPVPNNGEERSEYECEDTEHSKCEGSASRSQSLTYRAQATEIDTENHEKDSDDSCHQDSDQLSAMSRFAPSRLRQNLLSGSHASCKSSRQDSRFGDNIASNPRRPSPQQEHCAARRRIRVSARRKGNHPGFSFDPDALAYSS